MLEPHNPPPPVTVSLPMLPLLDVPLLDVLRAGELLGVLRSFAKGDFSARMSREHTGVAGEIAQAMNDVIELKERMCEELRRLATEVGVDGRLDQRVSMGDFRGGWLADVDAVNGLITNLVQPTTEVGRVIGAFASGDLSRTMALDIDGRPLKGEFLRTARVVNGMVEQLGSFASEVTRVAREVGTEGKLGGQAQVKGGAGTWKDLTDNVNLMASNLTAHIRNIADVTRAVAQGDLSKKITVDVRGEILEQKDTINTMVDQLNAFASEVTRVAREVGTEGKLGGQALVRGAAGTWKDLTDSFNVMASNLTGHIRNIADVTRAVAQGDLSKKITVNVQGEILEQKDTINTMVDQLNAFASEVTRVACEVGTEGKLGGQAQVKGAAGTWKDVTDSVNFMASNLTGHIRNIADVTRAVARGDLSKKITVNVQGEILEQKDTINTMVDQLNAFASEVTRVAREVGTEGKLGGQAEVNGAAGTWKDVTESVNFMAANLTGHIRNIADVTRAVAQGDLSKKITVNVRGEILEQKDTINTMVDQLNAFASEVTRVAREVGTEGKLGGQAQVKGAAGTWKDVTESVNFMASNLTGQVRNIAHVTTAVANGDLSQKITGDVKGEILELKITINTMVDQLNGFASEVTRVAREVGTEGKLGGQAQVVGAAGTWKDLTDNVNQLAGNLTTQVRAIADVATAVTKGDLTRSITVEASGEVAVLKANLNEMIRNLKDSTQKTTQQDWLKTNLARFTRMMQGQRDLATVAQQILSELTPLVGAQHGVFYLSDSDGQDTTLRMLASYGASKRARATSRIELGEGLIGQCAFEKRKIHLDTVPPDYMQIESGLGGAAAVSIVILPVLFEGQCNAVIELGSLAQLAPNHMLFLDQLTESIGIVINTIGAGMRTEGLLIQAQSQTQELQTQQEELRETNERLERQAATLQESEDRLMQQQEQLRRTNDQIGEKAEQLGIKNHEIELAKQELEEKAEQLALTSKYKSEFLANMSHELRTPLNSLLILSKMLSDNTGGNLLPKQVEFARTIHGSGTELLSLINDILDLSKIESGTISVDPADVPLVALRDYVEQNFRHVAQQKSLGFQIELVGRLPRSITTDAKRLQQVLKNLLSNAFKFTERGSVVLRAQMVTDGWSRDQATLNDADIVVAFSVTDTGIGIAPDKQKIIFEAFQQSDGTTSRKYGGTGLGLSISREIARLLGGELRVVSSPDAGSTFTLYLPRNYVQPLVLEAEHRTIQVVDLIPAMPAPVIAPPPPRSPQRIVETSTLSSLPAIDDCDDIQPGDKVLLIIDDDVSFARSVRDAGRDKGFKIAIATLGEVGLAMARRLSPTAIILDLLLPDIDGWVVLDQLKHDNATRHIPVEVISIDDQRHRGLKMGALGWLTKPTTADALSAAIDDLARSAATPNKTLLLVEDNEVQRSSIMALIGDNGVHTTAVATGQEALAALVERSYSCMVLDLGLPDMSGFELLQQIKGRPEHRDLPIIIYTAKELSRKEELELKRLAETIIVKDVQSPERLLDETAIYLHRTDASLPEAQRQVLRDLHQTVPTLAGTAVLVVDDDVRNVFAITCALESHQATVLFAENGLDALALLEENPAIEVVLMDIMMPEMDGYEVMRRIRANDKFRQLPIIALTAKAMRDDREKCIQAGASDYIAKPIEMEKLLSMLRVWLSR